MVGQVGTGGFVELDVGGGEVAERIYAPDADVIDAAERIVLPGFVDTHRHTWRAAFHGVGADWTFAQNLVAVHAR